MEEGKGTDTFLHAPGSAATGTASVEYSVGMVMGASWYGGWWWRSTGKDSGVIVAVTLTQVAISLVGENKYLAYQAE